MFLFSTILFYFKHKFLSLLANISVVAIPFAKFLSIYSIHYQFRKMLLIHNISQSIFFTLFFILLVDEKLRLHALPILPEYFLCTLVFIYTRI